MPGQRREIEENLKKLPEKFSAREILVMYDALKRDMQPMINRGVPQKIMEVEMHKKHQTFAYAYPLVFFRVVRGDIAHRDFLKFISLKNKLDKGSLTQEDAKKRVIDYTRDHLQSNPSKKKPSTEGLSSQEFTFQCKLDDDDSNKQSSIEEED